MRSVKASKRKKAGGKDFQPGQSGNPAGRPPLPPDLKAARELNKLEMTRIVNDVLFKSVAELELLLENSSIPASQAMVISLILTQIKMGCPTRAEAIWSRLLGRIPAADESDGAKPLVIVRMDGGQIILGHERNIGKLEGET